MKLLARANVKHGGESKLDQVSGTIRTVSVATVTRPGEMFEVADEKEAERLIADGVAVDPKEASKEEKDQLPVAERRRLLQEELATLEADDLESPRGQDIRTHRAQQAEEEAAIEAAQKAEKDKGKGGKADKSDKDDKKPAER